MKNKVKNWLFNQTDFIRRLSFAGSLLWLSIAAGMALSKRIQQPTRGGAAFGPTTSVVSQQSGPGSEVELVEETASVAATLPKIYIPFLNESSPPFDYCPIGGFSLMNGDYDGIRIGNRFARDPQKDYTVIYRNPMDINLEESRTTFAKNYLKKHLSSQEMSQLQETEDTPFFLKRTIEEPLSEIDPTIAENFQNKMLQNYCYEFRLNRLFELIDEKQKKIKMEYLNSDVEKINLLINEAEKKCLQEQLFSIKEEKTKEIRNLKEYLIGDMEETHLKTFYIHKLYKNVLTAYDTKKTNLQQQINQLEAAEARIAARRQKIKIIRKVAGITAISLTCFSFVIAAFNS